MTTPNRLLDGLPASVGEFSPHARYFLEMDMLIYLREDCSYSTERIDAYLSLLWHPSEDRVVGFKLKGFKNLFNKIRAKDFPSLTDTDWVSIYKILESVFTELMSESQDKAKDYLVAKTLAGNERVSASDLVGAV